MTPPSPDRVRRRVWWSSVALLALAGGALSAVAVAPFAGVAVEMTMRPRHLEVIDPSRTPPVLHYWWQDLVAALATTVLFAMALTKGIRTEDPRGVRGQTVLWCIGLGWVNGIVVLSTLLALLAPGQRTSDAFYEVPFWFVGILGGACWAAPVSLILGAAYGWVAALPAHDIRREMDRPTLDGVREVLQTSGGVVFGVSLVATLFAAMVESAAPNASYHAASPWLPLTVGALGGLVFAAGAWPRSARSRLVDALNDDPDGWTRLPIDELPAHPGELVRTHTGVPEPPTIVLCRVVRTGDAAYRDAETLLPWAYDG